MSKDSEDDDGLLDKYSASGGNWGSREDLDAGWSLTDWFIISRLVR